MAYNAFLAEVRCSSVDGSAPLSQACSLIGEPPPLQTDWSLSFCIQKHASVSQSAPLQHPYCSLAHHQCILPSQLMVTNQVTH